ncbi:MAG: DUF1345 domain-containing protein [Telmatospirillum sp.]|nr:DUF1345 domain-containing protein [Telmatospirillum sp.]
MQRLRALVWGRPRLFAAFALLLAIYLALPGEWRATTRFLVAFDVAIALYLALAVVMFVRSTLAHLKRRAADENTGAVAILILTVATTLACLAAIAADLAGVHTAPSDQASARLGLEVATIFLSWFFLHTIFAIHYAHEFHAGEPGLVFPGGEEPDYWDFLYFAFTIGATAQTSDVGVAQRRMRRTVLAHAIFSFFFNAGILALAVNVGASLI